MKTSRRLRTALLGVVMVLIGFCYGAYAERSDWLELRRVPHFTPPETLPRATEGEGAAGSGGALVIETGISDVASLGYLVGYEPPPPKVGVIRYDADLAYPGLNFYTTSTSPTAHLADLRGNILHSWSHEYSAEWPVNDPDEATPVFQQFSDYWRHTKLLPGGDVLAIYEGCGLIKLDRHSSCIWGYRGGFHHGLDVDDNGRIFVLSRRELPGHPHVQAPHYVVDDMVVELAPDGRRIRAVSILDAFANTHYVSLLSRAPLGPDPLHTNALQVLDGRLEDRSPAFRKGNVLISARNIDVLAIIDLDLGKVVWAMTGMWRHQHMPQLLENGNLLLFDNQGHSGFSKVIEFNPLTHEIAWTFEGNQQNHFRSRSLGFNQRLPNGNTLITDSENGRAFEVTQDQQIVWEFRNPETVAMGRGHVTAVIYEMVRVDRESTRDWLKLEAGSVRSR